MIKFLIYLWELPQSIIFFIIYLFNKKYFYKKINLSESKTVTIYFSDKFNLGISLGRNIILNKIFEDDIKTYYHEYGHTKQSLILGWLYLLIIGIPSILKCRIFKAKNQKEYYNFYTEKWADKLGKVKR
jgi:hypothetical protein